MAVSKLVLADLSHRKTRAVLTSMAIALSVSLVVAVTTGYSSVRATVFKYFLDFVGPTDVIIQPLKGYVKQDTLDAVRADRDVLRAVGRLESTKGLVDLNGKPLMDLKGNRKGASVQFIGIVGTSDLEAIRQPMEPETGGHWFGGPAGSFAVVDQVVAKLLDVRVGDEMALPLDQAGQSTTRPLPPRLKIVGIVHKPGIIAEMQQTVYVPLETLQDYTGHRGEISRILVDLKGGASDTQFAERWQPAFPWLKLKPASESRRQVDDRLRGVEMLSYLGGTIAMLAAMFIVFSTLSMGVVERQRILGMLRAVGATRWQLASTVMLEGLLLGAIGAAVGVPAGLGMVKILAVWKSDYFAAGVVPNIGGMTYGGFGSLAAALLASLLPATMAAKIDVIDSITRAGRPASAHAPWKAAIVGLLLIGIDPLLMFGPVWFGNRGLLPDRAIYYGHFFVGMPGVLIGFFLLAPGFVWIVEKTLGRAISAAMGLRHSLLAQQLTGSIWRSAGTAAALMVGLSILVVLQTQGNSMLQGWRLPDKFPGVFLFSKKSLNLNEVNRIIEDVKGIDDGKVLPIAFSQNQLIGELAGTPISTDTTMFFGVDPEKALDMMGLEFLEGNAQEAVELLKRGKHVIVTDELRQLRGLHKGDTIEFVRPPRNRLQLILELGKGLGKQAIDVFKAEERRPQTRPAQSDVIRYRVAGVVWSPGIDVMVSMFDVLPMFEHRSIGSAFGTLEDAKEDFGVDGVTLVAMDLNPGVDKNELLERIKKVVGDKDFVPPGDVRQIKAELVKGFRRLLNLMSLVAYAAILVAALGVANTILASVRARRWQLGVLRSVGLTQSQMLRLILAEALLLGLVACVLGVSAGMFMSLDANQFGWWIFGYKPRIAWPVDAILTGSIIVLAVSIIASLWPAVRTAQEEPLELLQGGRTA